nr:phage minor capsid protein [Ruminococcus bromii]DAM17411.1 MAG TPA: minor capsid protein [Caudoviricetes sp.]
MNNLMRSEWLEQLPDYLAEIMQQMSLEATAIIAARINYIGKVKKSDIHKLTNALAYAGADINEIERVIARFTKKSDAEIERILTEVAAEDDSFAKLYYEMKGITPKTYITDAYLQTALTSVIKQTQEAIRNLSNTTSLFYQMPDGTYSDIRSTYIRVIDQAIYEVQSGSIDYHTAMKRAMLSLGKGTRCIEYMSGYHRRLDSAVRQNILDGTKQLNQAVMDYHGKSFGADGVELTAHAISAPDHVNVQGHRFTNEEFEKMQSGMDCKDIQGRKYKGFPRKITEWNCKHFAIPVIVDIGSPAYTDEQLEELKKSSTAKYDDTQKARAMETRLRTLKEQKNALLESGDEAGAKQIQKKITAQQRVYREFCKQKGIHRDYVRENVPKYQKSITKEPKLLKSNPFSDVTQEYYDTAKPGVGKVILEEGYKKAHHQQEIETAEWLVKEFGGEFVILKEANKRNIKTPDYIWRDRFWELKKISSITSGDRNLRKAISQIKSNPGGVILDITNEVELTALEKQLQSRAKRSDISGFDILIVKENKVIKIIRYKK